MDLPELSKALHTALGFFHQSCHRQKGQWSRGYSACTGSPLWMVLASHWTAASGFCWSCRRLREIPCKVLWLWQVQSVFSSAAMQIGEEVERNLIPLLFPPQSQGVCYPNGCWCHKWLWRPSWVRQSLLKLWLPGLVHFFFFFLWVASIGMSSPSEFLEIEKGFRGEASTLVVD